MHPQAAVDQAAPGSGNDLALGADAPLWAAAQVPLVNETYMPLPPPHVGLAGHALSLSDQQVRCMSYWVQSLLAQPPAGVSRWSGMYIRSPGT